MPQAAPEELPPAQWGHFLAGLCAGEACFAISWTGPDHRSCRCDFIVRMRADEEPLLRRLQSLTGVGTLRRHRARGSSRPVIQWRASALADLLRLVAIFDRYPLRSRKARDYAVWREAVLLLAEPASPKRAAKLRALKERLHKVRAYRPRGGEGDGMSPAAQGRGEP